MKKKLIRIAASSALLTFLASCGGGGQPPHEYTQRDTTANNVAMSNTEPGHQIFLARCSSCHGVNGTAQVNGAANLKESVMDSFSMAQVIVNGRGVMPPFKDALADSDIGHVIVFVRSLRNL